MAYSPPTFDPEPNRAPQPLSADDALPPVEPPSAGFIVQLFVVPGVIVAAIVAVWLVITWIAQRGDDPRQYFKKLQQSGPSRWQAAANLATAMRGDRHDAFKRDADAAAELAALLSEEIDAAEKAAEQAPEKSALEQSISLRGFMCKALGEFYVDAGLPVLLRAARTSHQKGDVHVRRAAIEAIALLAENVSQANSGQRLAGPQLEETLLQLSEDDDDVIRYTTAYAMGMVGGDALRTRLQVMLSDPSPDTRYNAAIALSRHGDPQALPVLLQMLDPAQVALGLEVEKVPAARPYKQASIMINAMRATLRMAETYPQVDVGPLTQAIERLAEGAADPPIRKAAQSVLVELKPLLERRAQAKSAAK